MRDVQGTDAAAPHMPVAAHLASHRPRGAAQLWDAAIVLVRAHWMPLVVLTALSVLAALPSMLARIFVPGAEDRWAMDFLLLLYELGVGSIVGGAVTVAVADAWHGRTVDVGHAVRSAMRRAGPLLITGVLAGMAMLLAAILFIVPGLLVAARYFAVGTVVVLEGQGVRGAFDRSVQLSRGQMGRLLATVGAATLVSFAVYFALESTFEALAFATPVAALLATVAMVPVSPFLMAVSVVAYFDARIRQEGYDLELAADALG